MQSSGPIAGQGVAFRLKLMLIAIIIPAMAILLCVSPFRSYAQGQGDCFVFAETQVQVCEMMLYRFRSEGVEQDGQPGYSLEESIARFGYPISPQFQENGWTAQRFQRALFAYATALAPHTPVLVWFGDGRTLPLPPAPDTGPPLPPNQPPQPGPPAAPLPPIGPGTPSPTGETLLIVFNDSPLPLRLTFTGTEDRIIELPACDTCGVYSPPGPSTCPAQGPSGEYVFKPGPYNVRAEFGSDVTPFEGSWTFEQGYAYGQCFFIISR